MFRFHQGGHLKHTDARQARRTWSALPCPPSGRMAGADNRLPGSTSTPSATPSRHGCAAMVASIPRDSSRPTIGAMSAARRVTPMRSPARNGSASIGCRQLGKIRGMRHWLLRNKLFAGILTRFLLFPRSRPHLFLPARQSLRIRIAVVPTCMAVTKFAECGDFNVFVSCAA